MYRFACGHKKISHSTTVRIPDFVPHKSAFQLQANVRYLVICNGSYSWRENPPRLPALNSRHNLLCFRLLSIENRNNDRHKQFEHDAPACIV